jgi:hypothetical protein
MKIAAILILGYFAIGFFGTGFLIEAVREKPKKANTLAPERPPTTIPLVLLLTAGFLSLPFLGYRKAKKQGTFLHFGPGFWVKGPTVLFVAGVVTALVVYKTVPAFSQ